MTDTIISKYFEQIFTEPAEKYLLINDKNNNLKSIEEFTNYKNSIKLFNKEYLVKLFFTSSIEDFKIYFEKNIRDKKCEQNLLIILTNNNNFNYQNFAISTYKSRTKYIEFNIAEVIKKIFHIELEFNIIKDFDLAWFVDRSLELLNFYAEFQDTDKVNNIIFDTKKTIDFINDINLEYNKRINSLEPLEKPLFIVDMTLIEFNQIIRFLKEISLKYFDQNSIKSNRIKELKKELKIKILDMFGKFPIDENNKKREITSLKTKKKIASNYIITIKQLNLIEDHTLLEELYNLLESNLRKYYQRLRELLLTNGKWNIYLEAIEKANEEENIENMTQYLEYITIYIYSKYHNKYDDLKKERWRKQLQYVLKWLKDEKLNIVKQKDNGIGFEIIKLRDQKITSHYFNKNTGKWYIGD